jgi:hypothetical protein
VSQYLDNYYVSISALLDVAAELDRVLLAEPNEDTSLLEQSLCTAAEQVLWARDALYRSRCIGRLTPAPESLQ